jgi:hypothetical protein
VVGLLRRLDLNQLARMFILLMTRVPIPFNFGSENVEEIRENVLGI